MAASSINNDEVHDGTHQKCQMICGVSFWVEKMYALRFAEVKSQVLNKSNIILES